MDALGSWDKEVSYYDKKMLREDGMKSLIDISEQDPVNLVLAAEAIGSIERERKPVQLISHGREVGYFCHV